MNRNKKLKLTKIKNVEVKTGTSTGNVDKTFQVIQRHIRSVIAINN